MTLDEAIKHAEEIMAENLEKTKGRKTGDPVAIICLECAEEHRQLAEWLKELKAHREAWEKCIKEIKDWYWNSNKQSIAKDPCVVDAMVDLFIRTIKECRPEEGDAKLEQTGDAISRKEVIDTIFRECSYENLDVDFFKVLKLRRAIKALQPVTPQPCEDAISRQAAQAKIKSICDEYRLSYEDGERKPATGGSAYALGHAFDDLPPATPKSEMGRWIIKGKEQGYDIAGTKTWYLQIMCDKCGFIKTAIEGRTGQDKYCQKCGRKMQEVEEN